MRKVSGRRRIFRNVRIDVEYTRDAFNRNITSVVASTLYRRPDKVPVSTGNSSPLELTLGTRRLLILSFTAQPETLTFMLAGASGWAVNGSPQDATKSTVRKRKEVDLEQSI